MSTHIAESVYSVIPDALGVNRPMSMCDLMHRLNTSMMSQTELAFHGLMRSNWIAMNVAKHL